MSSAKGSRGWDIPPCLSPRRSNTLGDPVTVAEQLIVLRENFRHIPAAGPQELYCAYHLMNHAWSTRQSWLLTRWIAKWGFGYLLLPCRIVGTMAVVIGLFAYSYLLLAGFAASNLVFSNGQSIFHDGMLLGVFHSVYFSIVTFLALGYGDIHAVGCMKLLAALEAFVGLVVVPVLVVSLTRRLFRW